MEVKIITSPRLKRKLCKLADLDRQPEMAAAKRQIGTLALQDQRRNFSELSNGGTWPALSDVAVILRPGGPKIYGKDDIEAKRRRLKILRSSNRLFASLTPGAPGNVMEVLPGSVRIGTNVSYAKIQNQGGARRFEFDDEMKARLRTNVSPVKRGSRRPARRKDGKRNCWNARGKASPWNEFYFRLRGAMQKMHGKLCRVPKRKFLVKPPSGWVGKYARVAALAIRRVAGGRDA